MIAMMSCWDTSYGLVYAGRLRGWTGMGVYTPAVSLRSFVSLPVHPWVPAPVSEYAAGFAGMTEVGAGMTYLLRRYLLSHE